MYCMRTVTESARSLPVAYKADVLVAGAGPAGVMAAIASGRAGADTLLIERANCAGGIWTSGMLSWMLDVSDKGGILREIMTRIESMGEGSFARSGNFITFPETVKRVLDDMLEEANVRVLYYTSIAGVIRNESKITHAILESKAGRQAAEAKIFIDATGDGDLSYLAGCEYKIGSEDDGRTQPGSLIAMMAGVDHDAVRPFNNTLPYEDEDNNAKMQLKREMIKAGVSPSYGGPSLLVKELSFSSKQE